ncbi:MAG: ABC transporter substrate-binding protein [Planctomycetaceae bacterium]|nr:ABC transporter substrate-binding protein [Planctomycetaceae bacterium]
MDQRLQTGRRPRNGRDLMRIWGIALLLTLVGFVVAWMFVEPAPPRRVRLLAGPASGAYYDFARQYAEFLSQYGIELEVLETSGTAENYQRLLTEDDVQLAIVQGGACPSGLSGVGQLESVASLYLEPLWVFVSRTLTPLDDLRSLRGKRIAIGQAGSGTQLLARQLLTASGVDEDETTHWIEVGGTTAAEQLLAGDLDAVMMVGSPHMQVVHQLLGEESVVLTSLDRSAAYSRRFPFLDRVTLYEGVVDLKRNQPPESVEMVAAAANLVVTQDFHDALIPLLIAASRQVHGQGDELSRPGVFPSLNYTEFPVNTTARNYFQNGPSFLTRILPYWVASLINRTKILLVPLLTLLIPLVKLAPPVYRWQIRSRIYRWYGTLREIDQQRLAELAPEVLKASLDQVNTIEQELQEVSVPLSYMEEFYNLRLHIDLVRRRLQSASLSFTEDDRPQPL